MRNLHLRVSFWYRDGGDCGGADKVAPNNQFHRIGQCTDRYSISEHPLYLAVSSETQDAAQSTARLTDKRLTSRLCMDERLVMAVRTKVT